MSGGDEDRTFSVLVPRFLRWLEVHGYAKLTAKTRGVQLARFVAWADARGIQTPNHVTPELLGRYQRALFDERRPDGRPLAKTTQAHLMSGVAAFLKWCRKQRLILSNPALDLDLPKYDRKLPKLVLSPTEVETFLTSIDPGNPLGLRDRALFEVFYSTAVRRAELVGLDLGDLDAERGTLHVRHGKGDRERYVPIGDRALGFVDRYVSEVRAEYADVEEPALFVTTTGSRMSKSTVSNIAADRLRAANIQRGGCHLFRHATATSMLDGGADVRHIQALLGHAHLSSTEIYTKVALRKLKEVHTRTHPATMKRSEGSEGPDDHEPSE